MQVISVMELNAIFITSCLPGYLCKDGGCYRSEVLAANSINSNGQDDFFDPRSGFQSTDDGFVDYDFLDRGEAKKN